jgi:pimeloyl-ACP methyl ester carboxylesterase
MTTAQPLSSRSSFVDQYLELPGSVTLRCRQQGQGEAVLLLHGFSDSLETFWELGLAPRLAEDFRVVAFDARGHGLSSKPHDAASYTDDLRTADALWVLDALGAEAAHVVGYSMGGWQAMLLAVRAPDRVRSLVVGGAQPFAQSLSPLRDALAAGPERWLSVIEHNVAGLTPEFRVRFARNEASALAAAVVADRAALPSPTGALRTLWFTAERDPLAPAIASAAQRWSPGRLLTLGSANHFDALAHPALLPALRRFLVASASHHELAQG